MKEPIMPSHAPLRRRPAALALAALLLATSTATAAPGAPAAPAASPAMVAAPDDAGARARYASMVRRVADMAGDGRARQLASRHRLDILNVLWEDTGRWQGSSLGPNISDVTIEVEMKDGRGHRRTALMPVMRYPNFTDKTGDVALDRIWIPVGNQAKGGALTHVTLRDFLAEPARYLSLPDKGKIRGGSLLAKRDSHALVSAQATFLPIPQAGEATFWPVIFNYQSTRRNPAVLTLLVTRQGTSATVVDNARDTVTRQSWGQRLFFNAGGERAPLTAERLSTVQQNGVTANGEDAASLGADANLLMIVQIPLKVRTPPPRAMMPAPTPEASAPAAAGAAPMESRARRASDVEAAVLGHGPELGPYTELAGLTIARDPRFPVRVTVQFYQATSNGVLASADVATLASQIAKVYKSADYVGSLVVPAPRDRRRPTNWDGTGPMPPGTRCEDFPAVIARGLCKPGHTANTALVPAPRPATPPSAGIH
jgi:hypothetical protein